MNDQKLWHRSDRQLVATINIENNQSIDQKLMVRSKYEKYEILLVEGTNKLSITHDSVKKKQVRLAFGKIKQTKKNDMLRSTWIELC